MSAQGITKTEALIVLAIVIGILGLSALSAWGIYQVGKLLIGGYVS